MLWCDNKTVMKTALLFFVVEIKVHVGRLRQDLLRRLDVFFGHEDIAGTEGSNDHAVGLTHALLPRVCGNAFGLQAIGNDARRQKTGGFGDDLPANFLWTAGACVAGVVVKG